MAFCLLLSDVASGQRLASDFEISQMEKQIAESRGFEAQLSARLNLGDARAARNEISLAREEYRRALDLSSRERLSARAGSGFSRYANATSWAALASAKLGREQETFALLEETARYASDDAEAWNLYASAMRILGHPRKAVAAARNAVAIAEKRTSRPLDLAIYRHALATAHLDAKEEREAEALLNTVIATLESRELDDIRKSAERLESFEVYSSARGDVASYVSLLNRTQLRLAALCESRGDPECARQWYQRVLARRSDDVVALGALARLARSTGERARLDQEAFDANPFSPALVREYRLRLREVAAPRIDGDGRGARMRRALVNLERGDLRAARTSLDSLLLEFPSNETLKSLRREAEGASALTIPAAQPAAGALRAFLNAFDRITPAQRAELDSSTFTSMVRFEPPAASPPAPAGAAPVTVFETGVVDGVPFRFASPTRFAGTFDATTALRLSYRILGVTRQNDSDALLLEPVRLERAE